MEYYSGNYFVKTEELKLKKLKSKIFNFLCKIANLDYKDFNRF